MEDGTIFQPRPTNVDTSLALLKEKEETAMLRKIVQKQNEQLKARDAENLEMRDIIKKFKEIQISNRQQIERIAQNNTLAEKLFQLVVDDRTTHSVPESSICYPPPPNHALPSKSTSVDGSFRAPASTSHSRNKSTVSSSAGTTTTTSSQAGNLKEVSRQIDDINSKMKSILKSLRENKSITHDAKHDETKTTLKTTKTNSEDFNRDVGRDSGIGMGESPEHHLPVELGYLKSRG
jgi:hypothetical protein